MWIAQDFNGKIFTYERKPTECNIINEPQWLFGGHNFLETGKPNPDWRDSLINLETHDYKIIDGILIKIDKIKKKTPRPHAELACKYFMDNTVKIQFKRKSEPDSCWTDINDPSFHQLGDYREKPKNETRFYRNYIKTDGSVGVHESIDENLPDYETVKWLGSWRAIGDNDD